MATIIDGKAEAAAVRASVREEVATFRARTGAVPGLATVLVGNDPASATYVRSKHAACAAAEIASFKHELPATASLEQVLDLIRELNTRADVHGVLVQLPLPPHLDEIAVIGAIDPAKDVDGLHPLNQAHLLQGRPGLRPCTPLGVMHLLRTTGVGLKGKRAVVAGRSLLVGKPIAFLLLEEHATVTICHSRTRSLEDEVRNADILVAAIGKPLLIRGDWVRPDSIVLDVGINRIADGRLVGDVEFEPAAERAAFITPVPGGVGPMTVAMLLRNTLIAAEAQLA